MRFPLESSIENPWLWAPRPAGEDLVGMILGWVGDLDDLIVEVYFWLRILEILDLCTGF